MADGSTELGEEMTSHYGFNRFESATVGALYMLFCVVGVTTNLLTALTFYKDTKLLKTSKPWIHVCLALSNVLVVAPSPFPASSSFSGRWLYGSSLCQFYAFEGMFVGIAAIGAVIALCIERYMVASKPNMKENPGWFYTWSILLVVGNAFFWAVMPLLGWSRYTIEHSGTSCAIDWKNPDESYISYMVSLEIFSFLLPVSLAVYCLRPTAGQPPEPSTSGDSTSETSKMSDQTMAPFNENQLKSICYIFLGLVIVGWGPFAFLCTSTMFGGAQGLSMLAASLPPLACKCMVSAYPLVYAVASPRFRHSFTSVIGIFDQKQD
ncbi:retinochrome-like [Biomphalaria glabrata]|uniref:Retinochrome-like n=1 Tax=Biomphalaria glabrata TaxID=6526 RepID=A0A9U8EPJ6_BIOGL|nr:retinochrome-like [Biomphalaria glabrata]